MINLIYVGMFGGMGLPMLPYAKEVDFMISFDPLYNKKCKRKRSSIDGKHFKYAVFEEEGHKPFYVLKKTQCSSLYEPNYDFIQEYLSEVPSKYALKEKKYVECIRLDSVLNEFDMSFDFVIADAQGADFDVVKSMGTFLQDVVGLHLELYLHPFYKEAGLFEEADEYLTSRGFYLAKRLRESPKLYDNFVYLRKDTDKQKQLNWIKKVYEVN